jgi:hypothetical protein
MYLNSNNRAIASLNLKKHPNNNTYRTGELREGVMLKMLSFYRKCPETHKMKVKV